MEAGRRSGKALGGFKREEHISFASKLPLDSEWGLVSVIVGIDNYRSLPLQCATHDAFSFSEILKMVWRDRPVLLQTLLCPPQPNHAADEPIATKQGILSAIRSAAREAQTQDTFLFFFSGHGRMQDGEPCLVTIGEDGASEDLLAVREIQDAAAGLATQKRLVILDCCLTSFSEQESFLNCLKGLARGWSIFLSCSPGEISLEIRASYGRQHDYFHQGLFTASLIEGLRGGASTKRGEPISLLELAHFVSHRVEIESRARMADELRKAATKSGILLPAKLPEAQHPVLLSEVSAMGGPLQIVVAPEPSPSAHDLRRSWPSKGFINTWRRYLLGGWPVTISHKHVLREGGAFWYGVTMLLTLLQFCTETSFSCLAIGIAMGFLSAMLWWLLIPFAVAANEDYWHAGGYLTGIFYLIWHGFVFLLFAIVLNSDPSTAIRLGFELLFILAAVIICGCNASQAIIALAEPLRQDSRRNLPEAIFAFLQFRHKVWQVDLNNFIAMVSARPELYLAVLGVAALLLGADTYRLLEAPQQGIRLLRNVAAFVFVAWQVFWYTADFKFLQRELFKR